ncbi:gliding motility lipoprotein GldH [Prevotella sp. oral taxon 299]|uniref:gliding motility lipoprotein GldH n=1 Tax=Prevotella sp. oral taxon 299 TaxID=652716 RepID=UPI0001C3F56A|nr:gliding motility-associated lipoprotein GldH [Prevotella sp. oral taxon 299 str. F0039]
MSNQQNNNKWRHFAYLCFFFCTILTFCISCKRNVVYHHYQHTSIAGWERNDTISYAIPRLKTSGIYSINVGLRVTNDYPFTGLSLVVERKVYPSKDIRVDTLNCMIIDSKGNVEGKGVSYYQYDFPLSTLRLEKGDSLALVVRHAMKREILPGISDVGIMLRTN